MRRSFLAPLTLLTVVLLGLALWKSPSHGAASLQVPPDDGNIQFQVELPEGALPIAPAFVRLLRINLEPGASSPMHTHPGPEFARVESGTLSVTVRGRALLSRATTDGTPTAVVDAPQDEEFRMRRGDMLTYLPQTQMTFRNAGERPLKILSGVILPAGHQHPPGVNYVGGAPAPDAFEGVTPEILGDGIATVLPTGPSIVTIDRIKLEAGEPIPAFDGPIMLSVTDGVLDFTVVSGRVQISRTASPGPQPDAEAGTAFSLSRGDAAFFPLGMQETPRSPQDGDLQLFRMTIVATDADATPVPASEEIGVIAIATPSAPAETPTPTEEPEEPTAEPTNTAEPEPTEEAEPTATEQTGRFQEGDVVQITDDGVRLRSGPSTDDEIVTGLNTGDQVIIIGPSEEGSGFTWWPIRLVADENVTGYVADDFLAPVE